MPKTPKEMALGLIVKFQPLARIYPQFNPESGDFELTSDVKQCACASVDEMIEWSKQWVDDEMLTPAIIYLERVKQEIEKH